MATDAGELIIKISADVSDIKNQLQQVADKTTSMSATTVAKGELMSSAFKSVARDVVDFVRQSIDAFAEQEATMTRLGLLVGGPTAQAFKQFSEQMQQTTAFSDDAVLSLEAQLTQYGIYPGSVKEATKAALDFAAVTGTDLTEAGSMFARAMSGQSRELKQYGLDLSTTATRSENLATTVSFLEQKFGGAAETMKGTVLGSVQSLQNQFSDLQKKIGEGLVPVFQTWVGWLNTAMGAINKLTGASRDDLSVRELGIQKLQDEQKVLKLALQGYSEYKNQIIATQGVQASSDTAMRARMIMVTNQIKMLKQQEQGEKAAGTAAATAASTKVGATEREITAIRSLKDEINKLQQTYQHMGEIAALVSQQKILQAQIELAQMQYDETTLTQTTELETEKRLEQSKLAWETNASYSDQLTVKITDDLNNVTASFVNMTMSAMNSFFDSTAKMIVEGGRFKDVITQFWQQLAEQIISQIMRMIAEWLIFQAMTGGAGGFGGGIFGGFADGGMVNEPSIITGMKSGRSHYVGEAGPEMIVPTGGAASGSTNQPFGAGEGPQMGASGGGVTINIQGQFLEGSSAKWQKLVREQIVPQVRRYTMSTPVGPFNRKRGAS